MFLNSVLTYINKQISKKSIKQFMDNQSQSLPFNIKYQQILNNSIQNSNSRQQSTSSYFLTCVIPKPQNYEKFIKQILRCATQVNCVSVNIQKRIRKIEKDKLLHYMNCFRVSTYRCRNVEITPKNFEHYRRNMSKDLYRYLLVEQKEEHLEGQSTILQVFGKYAQWLTRTSSSESRRAFKTYTEVQVKPFKREPRQSAFQKISYKNNSEAYLAHDNLSDLIKLDQMITSSSVHYENLVRVTFVPWKLPVLNQKYTLYINMTQGSTFNGLNYLLTQHLLSMGFVRREHFKIKTKRRNLLIEDEASFQHFLTLCDRGRQWRQLMVIQTGMHHFNWQDDEVSQENSASEQEQGAEHVFINKNPQDLNDETEDFPKRFQAVSQVYIQSTLPYALNNSDSGNEFQDQHQNELSNQEFRPGMSRSQQANQVQKSSISVSLFQAMGLIEPVDQNESRSSAIQHRSVISQIVSNRDEHEQRSWVVSIHNGSDGASSAISTLPQNNDISTYASNS